MAAPAGSQAPPAAAPALFIPAREPDPTLTGEELANIATILDAYRQGMFPMADPPSARSLAMRWRTGESPRSLGRRTIRLYSPDPRAIMPLEERPVSPLATPAQEQRHAAPPRPRRAGERFFHVSRSLERTIRRGRFIITVDEAFEEVVRACAEPRPMTRDGLHNEPWIDENMVDLYRLLFRAGHAHSIEAWATGAAVGGDGAGGEGAAQTADSGWKLVGGVYGVTIGRAFFAESMFSRFAPGEGGAGGRDASKVCLVHLVRALRRQGFTLLDVQILNDHTASFGAYDIPREEYLRRLKLATGS